MIKELLTDVIGESAYLMKKDLEHVSEEQAKDCPSETCRSITDVVNECAGFIHGITAVVKGADNFPEADSTAVQPSTKDSAVAGFDLAVSGLIAAIESSDEATLGSKVMAPWGEEVTRAKLAYWAAAHNMYHDGQVCYYQNLKGDNAVHWM